MKRFLATAVCVLLVVFTCSCGQSVSTPSQPETDDGVNVGVVNPLRSLENAQQLADEGYYIDAPEGATDVSYTVISNQIGQVSFTLDGLTYTLRCSNELTDFHGVYADFDEAEVFNTESADISVGTISGGNEGALALWTSGDTSFSLYTGDAVTAQTIAAVAGTVAADSAAHYAG